MNPLIFIVGCDRSGTTLLRLMLNQHPKLYIPSESGFIPKLAHKRDEYGDFTQPYQRWFFIRDLQVSRATSMSSSFSIFGLSLEEADNALATTAPMSYPNAVSTLFRAAAQKKGKECWGDKTPKYIFDMNHLTDLFPKAKFVHVIRDGRDVASSIIKLGWRNSFLQAADYWQERVQAGMLAGSILGKNKYYELRYEDLITNPDQALKSLCTWLDLEFVPQLLSHHESATEHVTNWKGHEMVKKPIDSSKVSLWKRSLSRPQIADFESIGGTLLRELGYEVTNLKVSYWVRAPRLITSIIKKYIKQKISYTKF